MSRLQLVNIIAPTGYTQGIKVRLNKNSRKTNIEKKSIISCIEIKEIKPFYTLYEPDGSEEHFATLDDIAQFKGTSISNIYHIIENKRVKGLNFRVSKEEKPYIFMYQGQEYSAKNIKGIAEISKISVSSVHKSIVEFLNK